MAIMDNASSKLSQASGPPLPTPLPTFDQLFTRAAETNPDGLALVCMHQPRDHLPVDFPEDLCSSIKSINGPASSDYLRWTHAQLRHAGVVLGKGLAAHGVRAGQPIATIMSNCAEWMVVAEAAAILQCPFVPLNARSLTNMNELHHMLSLSGAQVLIVGDQKSAEKLEQQDPELLQQLQLKLVLGDERLDASTTWLSFNDLCRQGNSALQNGSVGSAQGSNAAVGADLAMIIFTSGTTSAPKGAIYTNTTISACLLSVAEATQIDQSSKLCGHMPNHHIGGMGMVLGFIIAGGSVVFASPSFDPGASLDAMNLEKCTNLPCVPAMVQAMAAHPKLQTTDTSSLTSVQTGATTILPEHLKMVHTSFNCTKVSNSFSATEGCALTFRMFDATTVTEVSVGNVVAGASLKICAPDTREPVPRGEAGEVHACGPQVIPGYLNNISPDSFYDDSNGHWFRTGDQAVMSETGEISISGRYKDMIIRGGENIAPAAIETVFDTKMGISAQVVGLNRDVAGEVPIAVLQPKKDQTLPPLSEIRQVLVKSLGPAFVPEQFYTLDDLGLSDFPRTSSGKVRKIDLRKILDEYELSKRVDEGSAESDADTGSTEARLIRLWTRVIGVDAKLLDSNSHIEEFADSITIMRLRSYIQREMGVDVSTKELGEAGTIKQQAALVVSKQLPSTAVTLSMDVARDGPPQTDDIALTLGDGEIYKQVQQIVNDAITPFGFSWEDDVEDVLPSWDLGERIFGSICGVSMVNFRATLAMKTADVGRLLAALEIAYKHHSMTRSFEVRGVKGEKTMRVIMRPNTKWFKHAIEEIPAVDSVEDLTRLLHQGSHFAAITDPYPALQFKIAHLKSSNTAGMIWSAEHSAFDGLCLYSFLEDLDALLADPKVPIKAHIPYKLWADLYYSQRTCLAAQKAVKRQVSRVRNIASHQASIFPTLESAPDPEGILTHPSKRTTNVSDPLWRTLPDLFKLKTEHDLSPFLLVKSALSVFLARKTRTNVAVFGQVENGRSWPSVDPWMQQLLPDCMDLAGPTLERSVQIIPILPTTCPLDLMRSLKAKQEDQSKDVHAPWNMVREALPETERAIFDEASNSTLLNYIPVRTINGQVVFDEMLYHGTRTNCDAAWLYFCGIEGEGKDAKFWTRVFSVNEFVRPTEGFQWAEDVTEIAAWMANKANWNRSLEECPVLRGNEAKSNGTIRG